MTSHKQDVSGSGLALTQIPPHGTSDTLGTVY